MAYYTPESLKSTKIDFVVGPYLPTASIIDENIIEFINNISQVLTTKDTSSSGAIFMKIIKSMLIISYFINPQVLVAILFISLCYS